VGYLGAIGADKGLMYLIHAWSILNYSDSTLIFAGSQSQMVPQFINKYANGGKYHIMGYVQHPADLYNKCSVYVQPSATEGFGMEIVEAMSYGRPVIVSDGTGASDCVTDGVDGFVVTKKNPVAIAEKIDWFKNHPKELKEIGVNAREKSFKYSWEKSKEKYVALWLSLLKIHA
jgi:glycosyltransferase involved in cell wall biosynthesis